VHRVSDSTGFDTGNPGSRSIRADRRQSTPAAPNPRPTPYAAEGRRTPEIEFDYPDDDDGFD
jgi:hypothetical protein